MKYTVTALTPLLVGDGHELAPIDYMVWKDQVNVLDQPRIFKLLARGPRLEGYLAQLRKATRATIVPVAADVATPEGQRGLFAACPQPDILINNNA